MGGDKRWQNFSKNSTGNANPTGHWFITLNFHYYVELCQEGKNAAKILFYQSGDPWRRVKPNKMESLEELLTLALWPETVVQYAVK